MIKIFGKIDILMLLAAALIIGCSKKDEDERIIFSELDTNQKSRINNQEIDHNTLNVAIAAMTSPNETYKYYGELIDYISDKVNRPIHISQRKTYKEVNDLIVSGKIDFAFICSGAYIHALEENLPIEILAIPIINQKAVYYAYLISNISSEIMTFSDLKGKSFAFTDPLSNTGYLYALDLIKNEGEDSKKYFSKTIFTYGHDYSIQAVNRNIVAGATVNSLIFDYFKENHPERVKNIVIINKSEPFGIPPVVCNKNLNNNIKASLESVFTSIHNDEKGKKILKNLMIDRYSVSDSTDYSSIIQKSKLVGK